MCESATLTNTGQIYTSLYNETTSLIREYEHDNINKLFINIYAIIHLLLPLDEADNKQLLDKILNDFDKSKETIEIMKYITQYYISIRDLCFKRIDMLKLNNIIVPKTIFNEVITYNYNMIDKFIHTYLNNMSKSKPLCRVGLTKSYIKVQLSNLINDCENVLIRDVINDLRTNNHKYFTNFDNEYNKIETVAKENNNNIIPHQQVNMIKYDITDFIETLPNEIEVSELVDKYNNYFGTHETVASLSHKQIIRDNFEVSRISRNGTKKKIYTKK